MKTQAGFLMTQIKQIGGRVFEQMLKDYGVNEFNGPQGKILYVLWERGPLTITKIARFTSLAKTTLTSMLDRMEASGLVERAVNPRSRREVLVRVTPLALRLKDDYDAISDQVNRVYYRDFTEEEITSFEAKLSRVLANLEDWETRYRREKG